MRLFAERMDALRDPLDPGFGFDMMRLAVPRLEALAATQLKLEGGEVRAAAMTELVDRLATRIGRGGVRKFAAVDTHIPEQAQLALPAIDAPPPSPWPTPDPANPRCALSIFSIRRRSLK